MATVKHVVLDDGTHAIGVGDGAKFVPFALMSDDRYRSLEENEHYTAVKEKGDKGKGGEK